MKRAYNIVVMTLAVAVTVVLLLAAYGGVIDPRYIALPALFTLALPHIAIVAIVVLIVCAVLRHRRGVIVLLAGLLLAVPSVKKLCPLSWNTSPSDPSRTFTVMSWNVLTLGNKGAQLILEQNPDIVLLQEASIDWPFLTHGLNAQQVQALKQRYPYRTRGYGDLAILSRYPYTTVKDETMRNQGGSHTYGRVYDLDVNGESLRIINLHMQSIGLTGTDKKLYKDIATLNTVVNSKSELKGVKRSLADKLMGSFGRRAGEAHTVRNIIDKSPRNLIVCGDFNDTPASYCYRTIRGDMNDSYVDCGTLPVNTYNKDGLYFKIDHMFYRGDLKAIATQRLRSKASDHNPIITTLEWTSPQ